MKLFLSVFLFLFFANPELSQVRKSYADASKSKENAHAFETLLDGVSDVDSDKVLVAYKGCALTLKSKFAGKISDKMKFMKQGAALIDASASAEPNSTEIRMIRLSVQESVPKMVKYKKNIAEDKAFLISNLKKLSEADKIYISNFIRQSKSFTAAEKNSAK